MKLLNVQKARSIWLLEVQDLNPTGFDLWPMMEAIQNRYSFAKAPSREQSRINTEGGIQFAEGSFVPADSRRIAVAALSIYNDGFVADTRTDSFATDEFLNDVLQFCRKTFSLTYDPQMAQKRGYLSELIVTTERRLNSVGDRLASFANTLSEFMGISQSSPFEVEAVRFSVDHAIQGRSGPFSIERQVGTPFSKNRYYSQAPLRTIHHLDVLNKFEEIVLAD
jgi:hypothetical protein